MDEGLSRRGYFHWRSHIASFIDRNWAHLMDPNVKKRKNWIGTISGTLSHNSPHLFTSGLALFNEPGWWKLTHNKTPKQYYEYSAVEETTLPLECLPEVENDAESPYASSEEPSGSQAMEIDIKSDSDSCFRTLPFMGKYPWRAKPKEEEIDILGFMDSNENSNFLDDMPPLPTLTSQDVQSIIPSFTTNNENDFLVDSFFECKPKIEPFTDDEDAFSAFEPRILQVTNYQEPTSSHAIMNIKKEIQSETETETIQNDETIDEIPYEEKYKCEKSLFKTTTRATEKYPWECDFVPDEENNDDFTGDKNFELMNEYEETEIYKRLKTIFDASPSQQIEIPPWIRRHYRKLCVRRTQRSLGLPVFNVDTFCKIGQNKCDDDKSKENVLDRFHHLIVTGSKVNETFMARLAGSCQYELFVSPHTERVLHPFIYRNASFVPPWVKLMCELQ